MLGGGGGGGQRHRWLLVRSARGDALITVGAPVTRVIVVAFAVHVGLVRDAVDLIVDCVSVVVIGHIRRALVVLDVSAVRAAVVVNPLSLMLLASIAVAAVFILANA